MTAARGVARRLRTLAQDLLDEADQLELRRREGTTLAADVYREMTPRGASINASRSHDGIWYAYVVLLKGTPKPKTGPKTGLWIWNESAEHWWADVRAETEDEALRLGLALLIEAGRG